MDEGDGKSFMVPCSVVGLIIFVESFVAWHVWEDALFWHGQLPAMCTDGRLKNESFANITFTIDDTIEGDDGVHMKCAIPVHVYPCPDTAATFCRDFESEQPLPTPRVFEQETGLLCIRQTALMTEGSCRQPDFTCSTGPCTAYEKAGRLCAANIIEPDAYECYYIPSADIPIRKEHSSFPIWWLLILIVLTVPAVGLLSFMVVSIKEQWLEVGLRGVGQELAALFFLLVCTIPLVVLFGAIFRPKHARGQTSVSMTEFALEVGPDGQVVLPEEEPIQQPSILLMMLGSLCIVSTCVAAGIGVSFLCSSRKAAASEEEEEESDSQTDSQLRSQQDPLIES